MVRYFVFVIICILVGGCRTDASAVNESSSPAAESPRSKDDPASVDESPLTRAAAEFADASSPPLGSNVVLVVVDTLRADRLGAYGYAKNTSPTMDELAREGILFHRFYAGAPWTAPAFGTIFTGVAPSVHLGGSVLHGSDAPALQQSAQQISGFSLYPIADQVQTMAELLQCCVDVKSAIVSNPFLHPSLGFQRGFDDYNYQPVARDAETISNLAIQWLQVHRREQFMLLIHYMDVHQPYNPKLAYQKEFFPMNGGRLSIPMDKRIGELQKMKLTDNESAFMKGLYDAEIRTVDTQLGRVVDSMKQLGLLDNTWLVVTADHGTEHGEHGSYFHGLQYENEVTRIPLIIRAPGGVWGHGNQVVYSASQMDLLPTVLDWYQAKIPSYVQGRSLMPLMTGAEKSDRPCFMEMSRMRDDPRSNIEKHFRKRALFDGRYKTILTEDGTQAWLYDLDRDPLEQSPLSHRYSAFVKSVRQLEREIENQKERAAAVGAAAEMKTLPSDVGQSLKNLGYVE